MTGHRSLIWNYFYIESETEGIACCNLCFDKFSFRTTTTNLKVHLKSKHILAYNNYLEEFSDARKSKNLTSDSGTSDEMNADIDPTASILLPNGTTMSVKLKDTFSTTVQPTPTATSDLDNNVLLDASENAQRSEGNRTGRPISSDVWNYFSRSSEADKIAYCNLCQKRLSFRSSITNLKVHLRNKHKNLEKELNFDLADDENADKTPTATLYLPDGSTMTVELEDAFSMATPSGDVQLETISDEVQRETFSDEDDSVTMESTPKIYESKIDKSRSSNLIWEYFSKASKIDKIASCNLCQKRLSYRTTISNLKSHLRVKHISTLYTYIAKCNSEIVPSATLLMPDGSTMCVELDDTFAKTTPSADKQQAEFSDQDDDASVGSPRQREPKLKDFIWDYFTKRCKRDKLAYCNLCHKVRSYRTTITNLKTHLKGKHASTYNEYLVKCKSVAQPTTAPEILDDGNMQLELDDTLATTTHSEDNRKSDSSDQDDIILENPNYHRVRKQGPDPSSLIWNYFTKSSRDNKMAVCNLCRNKFSYRTTISNLKKHLKLKHKNVHKKYFDNSKSYTELTLTEDSPDDSNMCVELDDTSATTNFSDNTQQVDSSDQDDNMLENPKYHRVQKQITDHSSLMWKYFTKSSRGDKVAVCNLCQNKLSYRTTITNLKKHLKTKHEHIYKMRFAKSKSNTELTLTEELPDDSNMCVELDDTLAMTNHSDYSQQVDYSDQYDNASIDSKCFSEPKNPFLWVYFSKCPGHDKHAYCKMCQKILSYRTSITHLKMHLKNQHRSAYKKFLSNCSGDSELTPTSILKLPDDNHVIEEIDPLSQSAYSSYNNIYISPKEPVSSLDSDQDDVKPQLKRYVKKSNGVIWKYFAKSSGNDKVAYCNLCLKKLSYRSSTNHLKMHLKIKHHPTYKKIMSKWKADSALTDNLVDLKPAPLDSEQDNGQPSPKRKETEIKILQPDKKKGLDAMLLKLIIRTYKPLSIVDEEEFQDFVGALNQAYQLPRRKTILSKWIPSLYRFCLEERKKTIQDEARSVCLTIETWMSSAMDTFMGVTIHFITSRFDHEAVFLKCSRLSSYNTEAIGTELNKIVDDWDLRTKIAFCVTDNDCKIVNAITLLGWTHYVCYAQKLSCVVIKAVNLFEETINKVNAIVDHFNTDYTSKEMLMEYQESSHDNSSPTFLIKSVPSQWNSIYHMIERFTALQDAIIATILSLQVDLPILSEEEWLALKQLCIILKPFEECARILSSEKYMHAGKAITLTSGIVDVLKKLRNENFFDSIEQVLDTLTLEMGQQFAKIEFHRELGLCTILDPRFKMRAFADSNAANIMKNTLINKVEEMIVNEREVDKPDLVSSSKTDDYSVWNHFVESVQEQQEQQSAASLAHQEVELYLNIKLLERDKDPCAWWREHVSMYPHLSQIFLDNCHLVVTSVPCKGLFTEAGRTILDRRSCLSVTNTEQLVFLNANLKDSDYDKVI